MLWLILGIVLGTILYHVAASSRAGRLKVRWYQWILGVLAAALLLLAIQNYVSLQDELEPAAAALSWLLFGLPAVILAALIWVIPFVAAVLGKPGASKGAKAPA